MITILPQSSSECLAVHFSGKVTGREYQQFLDAINERLKSGKHTNLLIQFTGFEFYGDFEAAVKDFKFGTGEYKHIYRAAFVGDQKWIAWFTRFIGPFTQAEEKQFSMDQFEAAFNWASTNKN